MTETTHDPATPGQPGPWTLLDSPEHRRDPYPAYRALRDTGTGLQRSSLDLAWVTATHAHCLALLRDPRMSSNPVHLDPDIAAAREAASADLAVVRNNDSNVLLFMDPPDHTRLRRLANKAFTPRAVQRLRHDVERIAGRLLDDAGVAARSGPFDVVDVLARPLPLVVICQMFGIPEVDRDQFFRWSDEMARALGPVTDPAVAERAVISFVEFSGYFFALADDRRAHLGDDLQLAVLRADLGLVTPAIDELLRFDSPVQLTARIATEPVAVDGTGITIAKGQDVLCLLGGANHDPAEFGPDADDLDVRRDARNHLSFGGGVHYCLGASLARLEGAVAFTELLRRCPRLELVTQEPEHREHAILRGLEGLVIASG